MEKPQKMKDEILKVLSNFSGHEQTRIRELLFSENLSCNEIRILEIFFERRISLERSQPDCDMGLIGRLSDALLLICHLQHPGAVLPLEELAPFAFHFIYKKYLRILL